ncbi:MAG: type II toxin-antitoxin system PemK/MazF family toxin [Acidobacteriia bacterium]|nr:type II toxin-antitoxin system PemK/MazF family toxin [Terriglobia bacterium]
MVNRSAFVPAQGDAVWITLNPQAGHEQAGRRPAVVLSPRAYNGKVGLALLCPITKQNYEWGRVFAVYNGDLAWRKMPAMCLSFSVFSSDRRRAQEAML